MKQLRIGFANTQYPVSEISGSELPTKQYKINYINKVNEAEIVAKQLQKSEVQNFGIDIETYKKIDHKKAGLEPHLTGISIVQIYDGDSTVYVFDVLELRKHDITSYLPSDYYDKTIEPGLFWLRHLTSKNFVAHYGIFELKHLTHNGFPNLNIGCSMLLSILVDRAERSPFVDTEDEAEIEDDDEPSTWKGYGLDAIIGRLFNLRIDKKFQMFPWEQRPLPSDAIQYAALDAILTHDICKVQIKKINEYKMQKHYQLLKKMQHVIVEMELNGMLIDTKKHTKLIAEWSKKFEVAKIDCAKHFGEINFGSTKQLNNWAKKKYNAQILDDWMKTKKGALGFGKNALASMQHLPEMKALLDYKKQAKLLSTYGETLQTQINPITNRVHCSFSLGETRTGRLSSREPNLQNLPRDSDMRNIFVASSGKKLIVADFNQIELRVAGLLSGDPIINGAYERGDDLHTIFAARMYKVPPSRVTKEQRQIAKSANFGAIYGMGPTKFVLYCLANGCKITFDEAKQTIDTLWSLYAQYGKWCNFVREKAKALGFVRTPMGKMRKLHEKEVYTKAPNTIVQGGAFEVMAASMIDFRERVEGHNDCQLINSVHDELIIECDEDVTETIVHAAKNAMGYGMRSVFPKATLNNLAKPVICDSWGEGK